MATKNEIKEARKRALEEVNTRLKENPNIGVHECIEKMLDGMNVPHEGKTPEELRSVVESLDRKQQKIIREGVILYKKSYDKAIEDYQKGSTSALKRIPQSIAGTLAKGASIGAGVAGVVNTIAPNLFPAAASFFAGASEMSALQKGLIFIGAAVAPEPISKGAIIGIGAATGAVIYGAGKLVKTKATKNKEDKER